MEEFNWRYLGADFWREYNSLNFEKITTEDTKDELTESVVSALIPNVLQFIKPILHDFIQDEAKEKRILLGEEPSDILDALLEEYISSDMMEENLVDSGYFCYYDKEEITITPGMLSIGIIEYLNKEKNLRQANEVRRWEKLLSYNRDLYEL